MATFDYDEFVDLMDEMAEEFGTTVTFTRISYVYNPETMRTTETAVPIETNGVMLQYETAELASNPLVEVNDVKLLISARGIEPPSAGDTVTVGTEEWQVINVQRVMPADTPIYFAIQIRR